MTLTTRIALAEKLKKQYQHEWFGLCDVQQGKPPQFPHDEDYCRGYEDGRAILERGEGL